MKARNNLLRRWFNGVLCFVLAFVLQLSVAAANVEVTIKVTDGANDVSIYTQDDVEVAIDKTTNSISVAPGIYKYTAANGAGGQFEVTSDTTEVTFAMVNFKAVRPKQESLPKLGTLAVTDQDGEITYTHATQDGADGTEKECYYVLPQDCGDSYYNYTFTPFDGNYLPIDGHFYVYEDTNFNALNLSDAGRIPYIKAEYITVKAPADMTVQTVWQLKFYTARNFKSYEVTSTDGEYNCYSIPSGLTLRLSQEGKVTRYGKGTQVGTWNDDHTVLTLRELDGNPNQISRDVGSYYASMMTNLPLDSEINLEVGEYFDLVPLRAWQAIDDGAANGHQDPDWHYMVIGDDGVVSVGTTADDVTGQFGRITANKEGTALVVFYYDAMQSANQSDNDEYGLYTWSALWPELTGVAVVNVQGTASSTEINSNIDVPEGQAVYYVRTQTFADGKTSEMDDHATYTFKPTATTNGTETAIKSVRVLEPLMVEDGMLNRTVTNWLKDSKWKAYTPDANGAYTLSLQEGRNVVEITAGDAVAYHVILARGLDVTVENAYNPGAALAVGDTAIVTFNGVLPPLFKMGAIYNPQGVFYCCNANGVETKTSWGQYLPSAKYSTELKEEDAGTFALRDGYLSSPAWGEGANMHRKLTRNSMVGNWSGGDSGEHANDKVAVMPDVHFEVTSNEEQEEVQARDAGWLKGLRVSPSNSNAASALNAAIYKAGTPVPQSVSMNAGSLQLKIGVGAVPFDSSTKLLVRYWVGTDSSNAKVTEIEAAEIVDIPSTYGGSHPGITLNFPDETFKLQMNKVWEANLEIISIPENGYPMTYGRHVFLGTAMNRNTANWILTDLKIVPKNGAFGRFDGVLAADDITYTAEDGTTVTQDLGYGFIGTEGHFTTSVPHETSQITVSAIGSGFGDEIEITVNGDTSKVLHGDDTIELQPGENTLEVTYKPKRGATALNGRTYTITINRAASPDYVTFEVPSGAEVTVKKSGKTQPPYATSDGRFIYNLPGGEYTYSVELEGYYTKTGSFTAPHEEKITVTLDELEPLPGCTGGFQVAIHGQQEQVCAMTAMAIPEQAEDLMAKKYVTYNHGGYTVLHALLDACEDAGAKFKCSKGVLTPSVTVDKALTASGAGWVCEVNGQVVADPQSTLVNPGDVIRYYYNNNQPDMTHAWFDVDTMSATRGSSVTVTLMGAATKNNGGAASAVSGADILVDGKKVATTDFAGKAVIPTGDLLLGGHTVTAEKKTGNDNLLTYAQVALQVNKSAAADPTPDTTEVTFRLIGDNKHQTSSHAYTTWHATETYTFAGGSVTVGDVFRQAMKSAGLESDDSSDNYVAWIKAPESLGGYELAQKDNGGNSGWMYTVNGEHPEYGLNDFEVTSGDEIIWHYIDDYTIEKDKFTWLAAEDVNPAGIDPDVPTEPIAPSKPDTPDNPDNPDKPEVPDSLNVPDSIKDMYEETAATLLTKTPGSGKEGTTEGEWMAFGLARSTFDIPESYKNTYLTAAKAYVQTMNASGQLDAKTPTENMRVALALKALGENPQNFEGKDLIKAMENTAWVIDQGNNATAFALLSMDACDYKSTDAKLRQTYLDSLIGKQNTDGGWSITDGDSDQDVSMMVVTALAPYYGTNAQVKTAVDKALDYIKAKQTADGGFGTTAEGNAQVVVALTALGIDPTSEDWTKDGKTVIDAMQGYFTGDGFMHDAKQPKYNQMASEQSFYALAAYVRYLNGQPSLYDMSAEDHWPAAATYTITVADAENGTVTTNVTSAEAGAAITVTATPAKDYTLDKLTWNGTALKAEKQSSGKFTASFTMPPENVTVKATFKAADTSVEDVAELMENLRLSSTSASQEDYEAMTEVMEAYDSLTREQQKQLKSEYPDAYERYEKELEDFNGALEAKQETYLGKLEKAYERLDEKDYSEDNWDKITDLYDDARDDLADAKHAGEMNEIVNQFKEDVSEIKTGGAMKVTFRLIGDFKHEDAEDHVKYVTWVPTTEYSLEAGATVYDLFVEAMDEAGLSHKGASSNYVSSIQAPDCLGGYWLGEFDNGRNSGWMYTVNGDHPNYGLKEWELEDGDEVVWHYIDDYKKEETKNTWLEARDIDPEDYVDDALEQILIIGKHGDVEPDEIKASDLGKDITFKFIPDKGYTVKDVKIDGKSVGKVTSYKYEDLRIDSRIEVEFTDGSDGNFTDVRESDWFYDDVQYAVQNGLFNGTSDTTFSPNASMTRAMLVTVLYRLEGEPDVTGSSPFDDVPRGQWYSDAVNWAERNDIVNGISDTAFAPNNNITREQMAAILYRYAAYKDYSTSASNSLTGYADFDQISAYALNSLKWANAEGLINGRTTTTLAPKGTATRAEVAAILHRFVENVVND